MAIGSAQDLYMNYNNLGMVYARKGSYTEAIKVNFAALHVIDSLELDVKTGSIFGVIGVIYQNMEQYENSYLYYRKAILADSLSGDDMGVITWEINWAIALQNEDKYLESKEVYLSSLIKARKKEYTRLEANVMCNLGSLLKEFDQPDSAAHYFKMGYDLADSVNATNLVGFSLRSLGQIYLESGDAEKAKPYIVESRKLAYQIDDVAAIRDAHGTISDYYELINQTDSAYHHYKLYTFYKDSILGESKLLEIGKMEAQHDYDKQKIIDDKEAEKKLELEKQKQEQQKIVIAVSLSAGAFVLILLIIIYRRLKITRTQKVLIEEQKEEVESQRDQIEDQNNLLETRHVEIQESISYAKRIQEAILPQDSLIEKWFKESFVIYKPKDVVAGDFYWFEEKGDTLYFAAADCTGHGVPGAMVSVVCHSALNRSVRECGAEKPSEILFKTRELVVKTFEKSKEQVKDGMDICLCSLNKKTKEFQFAGANNPLYILRNNEIEVIKGDNQPIGYDDDFNEFKNNVVDLSGADMIFLFTDGFPDQFGGNKGKKMGYKNFRNQLVENSLEPLDKQKTNLLNSFDQWKGEEEQVDDVCIIAVKLN